MELSNLQKHLECFTALHRGSTVVNLFLGCTVTLLKNISKIIQCIKSRNYDVIGHTSPSFRSVRSPKLQIFVEIFCTNLQSPVWSRHVGVPPRDTSMAAGKLCKHLELTLTI